MRAVLCRPVAAWQLADPFLCSRHEFLPDIEALPAADDVAVDNHQVVSK